ncbi:MAG: signal recognition particle-docking protein FtsY [Synergistota bacterium]|jgi:fused signal recognition particle receptor|nr:signal recognition particle-docking protein FtsY [Synergistota bacterium]OPZ37395.1 MAG: Signal recognition particle receptor FtsY [Synergistetes bacterium ADurb.BinA166]
MSFFERLRLGLQGVRKKWSEGLSGLFSGGAIDPEFWDRLEEVLISGDVGAALSQSLVEQLKQAARERRVATTEGLYGLFASILAQRLSEVPLMGRPVEPEKGVLTIVLLVGVNGSGKTTTAGKLACKWAKEGLEVIMAASDTFRAAAAEQLKIWGERSGVRVVAQQQGSDAAAVAFDALAAARSSGADVLIVDTAGRLHSKHNLMEELKKIARILDRERGESKLETLLVLDSVMGQNGLAQAKTFNSALSLSGVVLTKYDNTAKGGIILAIADEMKTPVRYVGLGEGEDDLRPFDVEEFVRALLEE